MYQLKDEPLMAISLLQPWATLLALGLKKIETRSWKTDYRGILAIQASLGKPKEAEFLSIDDMYFQEALSKNNYTFQSLPRGCIVAVAELVNCLEISNVDNTSSNQYQYLNPNNLPIEELVFGDYSAGRYAWVFKNITKLTVPIPCKGSLSLWPVSQQIQREVEYQVY